MIVKHQQLKKKINILFGLLLVVVAVVSCAKDEGLSAKEQSIADEELIQTYLKSHKLDSTSVHPPTHINWSVVEAKDGDKTLADIADKDTVFIGGVEYYTYFIEIEEGKSSETGETKDLLVVDFKEYLLDGKEIKSSSNAEDAVELELSSRVEGIKQGIKKYFKGLRPEGVKDINYRNDIIVPGRGIMIFPSGLGYGQKGVEVGSYNEPLRVDMVLYDKIDFPEKEEN